MNDKKLIPLACNLSKEAHTRILHHAANDLISKSEWMRRLVLNQIDLKDEISEPRTNFGLLAEIKANEEQVKKEIRKAKRLAKSSIKD